MKLKELAGEVTKAEYLFFLTGGVDLGTDPGEPPAPWLSSGMWGMLKRACELPALKKFLPHFVSKVSVYETLFESKSAETWSFPDDAPLNGFTRLLVFRIIRADKLVPRISKFIVEEIGDYYTAPPPFDLALTYADSKNITPLIFVLSPGADPMASLTKFSASKNKRIADTTISLG